MPSQSPTRAATAGLRSREVKSSSRGGAAARIRPLLRQDGEPAAARARGRASTREPGRARRPRSIASAPTTVHGNGSERAAAALELRRCAVRSAGAGRREVDDDPAAGREQLARRGAAARTGSPADADVAVGEQRASPSGPRPAARSKTSRCRALAPARRGSARRPRARRRCRARRARARRGARSSGPGRSRCRGSARGSARAAPRRRRRPRPAHRRHRQPVRQLGQAVHRARLPAQGGREERHGERRVAPASSVIAALPSHDARATAARTGCPARRRRRRRRRRRCRRRAASAVVGRRCAPASSQGAPACRRTSGWSTSARRPAAAAGAGSVTREHPPAAVLGRAEHGVVAVADEPGDRGQVGGGDVRGVHADLHDGRAGGRRHVGVGVREPLGEAVAALRVHGPAGQRARAAVGRTAARARSPASATWQSARGPPRRRRRAVSRRQAAASVGGRGPCRRAAPSRVLTWPGTGALAMTSTAGASRQHPGEVAGGAHRARAPSRTPWSGCPRRAGW